MAKHSIYARLSEEVYNEKGGSPPDGWEIIKYSYPNNNTSFGICAYRNETLKELVIAIRGTDNLSDLYNDSYLATHTPPPYLDHALEFPNQKTKNKSIASKENNTQINNNLLQAIQLDLTYSADYTKLMGYLNAGIIFQKSISKAPELFIKTVIDELKTYFITAPNDNKQFYMKLIELIAKYYSLGISELVSDSSFKNGFNIKLENSKNAMKFLEEKHNGYKIIFTGHSLGGSLAQLCSIILGKTCVTFDNPGLGELANNLKIPLENIGDKVTAYLSSPHIINTHGSHIGKTYRIYFPHVDENGGFWTKLRYFSKSLSNTSKKLLVASLVFTPAFFVALGIFIVDMLTMAVYDAKTLLKLHSITNIRKGLEEKNKLWKIESWPKVFSFIYAHLKSYIPFTKDYNLYRFFIENENDLIESKIKNMIDYKVVEANPLEINRLSGKDDKTGDNNILEHHFLKSKL